MQIPTNTRILWSSMHVYYDYLQGPDPDQVRFAFSEPARWSTHRRILHLFQLRVTTGKRENPGKSLRWRMIRAMCGYAVTCATNYLNNISRDYSASPNVKKKNLDVQTNSLNNSWTHYSRPSQQRRLLDHWLERGSTLRS
ncbi:hypothetical protein I7I51_07118 [Histoplasma capsulatum]|uniref:Uncharacterized protein n=1 Tax=Ajellomyces capsulatus TaxID=5037 RepID=A0A8A1MJJ2_AJECA|nr:hypothetical protein I7I51_07118 [Histoplasma capsulatum]